MKPEPNEIPAEAIPELHRYFIRERLNELADIISGGGAQDWAAYQKMVGMVQGYAEAESNLLELCRRAGIARPAARRQSADDAATPE